MTGKSRYLIVALAVLVLDQWTKRLIEIHLPEQSSQVVVPGFFHLSHVRNSGVAFGLFPAQGEWLSTLLLALLGVAALAVVSVFFWRAAPTHRRLLVALALVMGGAVGNLIDRLASGAVTDFLAFYIGPYRWPDFNVADSAISIGLALMVLDSFLAPRPADSPAAEPGA
jgi:signal peptidase II